MKSMKAEFGEGDCACGCAGACACGGTGTGAARLAAAVAEAQQLAGAAAAQRARSIAAALDPTRIAFSNYAGAPADAVEAARIALQGILQAGQPNPFAAQIARQTAAQRQSGVSRPKATAPEGTAELGLLLSWAQRAGTSGLEFGLARRRDGASISGIFGPRGREPGVLRSYADCLSALRMQSARSRDHAAAELYVRGPLSEAHRLLLVDDVPDSAFAAFGSQLARAVLETSPGNYQAILLAPEPLDRSGRLDAQRALVQRFGGDFGSVSGDHWGRGPGSQNTKAKLGGARFVPRLVAAWDGNPVHQSWLAYEPLGGARLPRSSVVPRSAAAHVERRDDSASALDLRWAWAQRNRGVSRAEIEAELLQRAAARGKSNPADYARLTLSKVRI